MGAAHRSPTATPEFCWLRPVRLVPAGHGPDDRIPSRPKLVFWSGISGVGVCWLRRMCSGISAKTRGAA